MSTNERDTHFLNFGRLLYEDLARNVVATSHKRFAELDAFKEEQATIIAQRAYDLVAHILKQTPSGGAYIHYFKDMEAWPEQERFANALADLAKIERKISEPPMHDTSEQS